ncbi:hypothetical protein [Streptomyces ossamyceticus]|uniref:hypothetical protein n=1 Tax=Streptomyces ossamyceticus TaxID=249581 RepID=UPI00342B2D99
MAVAATHLSRDHSADGAGRRTAELSRIAEGLSAPDAELVLLGDFNDGGDTPQVTLGMRDAWSEAHGPRDTTPTFDPVANPLAATSSLSGRASRLDRVLLCSAGGRACVCAGPSCTAAHGGRPPHLRPLRRTGRAGVDDGSLRVRGCGRRSTASAGSSEPVVSRRSCSGPGNCSKRDTRGPNSCPLPRSTVATPPGRS